MLLGRLSCVEDEDTTISRNVGNYTNNDLALLPDDPNSQHVATRTSGTPSFSLPYRHNSYVTPYAEVYNVCGIHNPVRMYEMIIIHHFNIIFRGLIQLICSTNWAGWHINNAATLRKANCKYFINCMM